MIGFHNQVGQQFLAGCFHLLPGFGFAVCFERHTYMPADPNIRYAGEMEVFHIVNYRFSLGVESLAVGHDVNFGDKFHGGKVDEG